MAAKLVDRVDSKCPIIWGQSCEIDADIYYHQLYLFQQEGDSRYLIDPMYMDVIQSGFVTPTHRRDLIDWIYQLTEYFAYQSSQSFLLSVHYLDRFCSIRPIKLSVYQAVGAACFLIATKVCETATPCCKELATLSAGAFDADMIKDLELLILSALKWDLNPVCATMFFPVFAKYTGLSDDENQKMLVHADVFLCLVQPDCISISCKPSVQAAAAICCAMVCCSTPSIHLAFRKQLRQVLRNLVIDPILTILSIDPPDMMTVDTCSIVMLECIRKKIPKYQSFNSQDLFPEQTNNLLHSAAEVGYLDEYQYRMLTPLKEKYSSHLSESPTCMKNDASHSRTLPTPVEELL